MISLDNPFFKMEKESDICLGTLYFKIILIKVKIKSIERTRLYMPCMFIAYCSRS